MFSMAVNTSRPKKNERPQSKLEFCPAPAGPPSVLNAELPLELLLNSVFAFSMLKCVVGPLCPLAS